MKRDIILNILKEEGYPEHMLENAISDLQNLQPEVATEFHKWVDDQTYVPSIEFEGYNYDKLIKNFGLVPVGAFLALDWLCRDPHTAASMLSKGIS